ncbi:electron transfer flavoprotein subunit beta/FixA family protein [Thermodesulfobacteriota bacterium]
MKIAVCIKQVIDVTFPFDLDTETCKIFEDDIFYVINPADLCAAQLAVNIKETQGAEIIFISFGPPRVQKALRHCLALGGDHAIQVWDQNLSSAGGAGAYILSRVMQTLSPDLVLCGSHSLDENCSEVAPSVAEHLNLPHVTGVTAIDLSGANEKMIVERKLEKGRRVSLECPLPAVLGIEPGLEKPEYASLPRLLDAAGAEITCMDLKSLGIDEQEIRPYSLRRKLVRLSLPRPRPKKTFTFDSSLSADDRMELLMSGGLQETKSDLLEGDPGDLADKLAEILKQEALDRA